MDPRFILLAAATSALLTAAVVPTLAQLYQTVAPADRPGGAQGAASIPDFSGIWAHYSFPGFEPLPSGPRPVMKDLTTNPHRYGFVGDNTNPILKPHAAEAVKKHGETELRGALAPNPRNQCWPRGGPFAFSNVGIQMIQQADRITILSADDHEVRRVRLNEPHPARVTPTWYGDSVGHYEGDTLVIDTVGFKVGPFSMIDWFGTPYTQALHVVERYRLVDYEAAKAAEARGERENAPFPETDQGLIRDLNYRGKSLQLHFTVEDDDVFTTQWSATVSYWRPLSPFGQWPEFVCAENARGYDRGEKAAVPTADRPDF
jgi:hypothetical protein